MTYVLGVDGGIASVGWALLDEARQQIVAAGSWCFDPPEEPKTRTPTSAIRRQHRGQRRVIRRRRQRMAGLRVLFAEHGLIEEAGKNALRWRPECDPWVLRAAALDRILSCLELALALGHIARHRGFRSNSKRDRGVNAPSDTSDMLRAIAATTDRLEGRTVGQLAASDPDWIMRKRNRGDYLRTVQRSDLQHEANCIFDAQRRMGSVHASHDLQNQYSPLAFDQRPLADSDEKVGNCNHEPREKRTAKRAPSFELFRVLGRLTNLKLLTHEGAPNLTPEQINIAVDDFGKAGAKLTFKHLRQRLNLAIGVRFEGVSLADEIRDVAAREGASEGTHALREALGEPGWGSFRACPEKLDRAAEVLTFREDLFRIEEGLRETGMEPWCADLLLKAVAAGRFARFKGAAHISAKTVRAINPGLRRGLAVNEAFAEAGYNHAARAETAMKDIANPVARKALAQMLKQVHTVIHEHKHLFGTSGLPDRIHVELARDIGKGQEERDKISAGLDRRNREKDRVRQELKDLFPGHEPTADDLLRFELWKEQCRTCIYTGDSIPPASILATDNSYQVDHILPWSRFGDDSFRNKALVSARANQNKRNRTPFEWLGGDLRRWAEFSALVESCKDMSGGKKAGFYLRRNAAEVEERFRSRNLNDTRYACRVLLDMLARWYPADERDTEGKSMTRHVFARPGSLTSKLRQVWGLEGRKKGVDGKRLPDDRHHALDAMIVAACSESMLQRLTVQVQQSEALGLPRAFVHVPQPWPEFQAQAHAILDRVLVARPEGRRARGEVHAATIRQIRERDGVTIVYERKAVELLTLNDLSRVKDGKERNAPTVAILRAWIEAGRPMTALPRSPKGDIIRKVRLETNRKVGVLVRGGAADRGDMARVDVFCEKPAGKAARFHLVPIYPHQISDPSRKSPPDHAIVAYKDESDWTSTKSFDFLFSLYNNSLVEIIKSNGSITRGYFKGVNRSVAAMALADPICQQSLRVGIGTKTLLSFQKLTTDRLGRLSHVARESRTWHGVVCI